MDYIWREEKPEGAERVEREKDGSKFAESSLWIFHAVCVSDVRLQQADDTWRVAYELTSPSVQKNEKNENKLFVSESLTLMGILSNDRIVDIWVSRRSRRHNIKQKQTLHEDSAIQGKNKLTECD